jgi:hypothetical protein
MAPDTLDQTDPRNCVSQAAAMTNAENLAGNAEWWYCDSQHRAKSLTKRLTNAPRTLAEAQKKICTSAVTTLDTMQQMVFQPASG